MKKPDQILNKISNIILDSITNVPENLEVSTIFDAFNKVGYVQLLDNEVLKQFEHKLVKENIHYVKTFYNNFIGSGFEFFANLPKNQLEICKLRLNFYSYINQHYQTNNI